MLLVFIILRYRRRRRRERDGENYGAYGEKERPGTRGSYNSMAGVGNTDVKERPSVMMSPDSGTTKVGGLSRTNTMASAQRGDAWELLSQPTAEPLPKLGILRKPTGEALTTNYAVSKEAERKPLKLAEPPPAKKKGLPGGGTGGGGSSGGYDDDANKLGSGEASTGGTTWSVFPKVDPDPKGLLVAAAQREVRPGSTQQAASLQKWLQSAVTVSPFGPLDSRTGPGAGTASATAAPPITTKGAPPPNRISEVKWPLQEGQGQGQGQDAGLAYAETPTVGTAALARSVSVKGMKGMGLPGKPRKLP